MVTVAKVIEGLNATIDAKKMLLSSYVIQQAMMPTGIEASVLSIAVKFVGINIDELERIRDDLLEIK